MKTKATTGFEKVYPPFFNVFFAAVGVSFLAALLAFLPSYILLSKEAI